MEDKKEELIKEGYWKSCCNEALDNTINIFQEIIGAKGIDDHKMMKEEKCEYCEKDSELYNDHTNSHSVILKLTEFPENKVKLGIDLYCGCEETSFLQYINIKYCPMCRKKVR